MATATQVSGDVVTVINIGPRGLDLYLRAVKGQASNPRIKCDGRSILLVSPGSPHERAAEQLDIMLIAVFNLLGIAARSYGSTFYRLPERQKGFEPDKSYYIQNVEAVRGLPEIDLRACPPPDLVIEVVVSHGPDQSIRVSKALRVPELWVYDAPRRELNILVLGESAEGIPRYTAGIHSRALPFLAAADIAPWAESTEEDDGAFDRRARAWAEAELAPRHRALRDQGNG